MPTLKHRVPKYAFHKPTGQARVRIDGKDFYLGPYGSDESKARYDNLVANWLDRRGKKDAGLTISQLCALWWRHCKVRYGQKGRGKFGHAVNYRQILRQLKNRHGKELASDFGPRKLTALRDTLPIELGWSRKYTNQEIGRVKQMFKWGAAQEYLGPEVFQALSVVEGLRKGVSLARECDPILSVSAADVDATLPFMPVVVADMVRLQRLVGCRPGEIVRIRPQDVDRSGEIWVIRLEEHKTMGRGHARQIYVGPKAQAILAKYLVKMPHVWCFPSRPGKRYSTDSYRRAVERSAERAGVPRWFPLQLRHAAATEMRAAMGLEAAQAILGHTDLRATQIYAEKLHLAAMEAARKLG